MSGAWARDYLGPILVVVGLTAFAVIELALLFASHQ